MEKLFKKITYPDNKQSVKITAKEVMRHYPSIAEHPQGADIVREIDKVDKIYNLSRSKHAFVKEHVSKEKIKHLTRNLDKEQISTPPNFIPMKPDYKKPVWVHEEIVAHAPGLTESHPMYDEILMKGRRLNTIYGRLGESSQKLLSAKLWAWCGGAISAAEVIRMTAITLHAYTPQVQDNGWALRDTYLPPPGMNHDSEMSLLVSGLVALTGIVVTARNIYKAKKEKKNKEQAEKDRINYIADYVKGGEDYHTFGIEDPARKLSQPSTTKKILRAVGSTPQVVWNFLSRIVSTKKNSPKTPKP